MGASIIAAYVVSWQTVASNAVLYKKYLLSSKKPPDTVFEAINYLYK